MRSETAVLNGGDRVDAADDCTDGGDDRDEANGGQCHRQQHMRVAVATTSVAIAASRSSAKLRVSPAISPLSSSASREAMSLSPMLTPR